MVVTNIGRHYQEIHPTEAEVLRLSEASNKKEKCLQLAKLRLLGDFHHNLKVLQLRKGLLILVRRPTHGHSPDLKDYLPCTFCLGFIHAKDMWRHVQQCPCRDQSLQQHSFRRYQAESRLLLQPILSSCSSASPALQQILNSMLKDEIGLVARGDSLILSYGSMCAEKMAKHEATYVSQKMRQLARLVIRLREVTDQPNAYLSDFLSPDKFEDIVSAVRLECQFVPSSEHQLARLSTPSLALKLGHALQKCAAMLRNMALKAKNSDLASSASNYMLIHETEWPQKVSTFALRTINIDRQNKPELLPLTSDIMKLSNYLDSEIKVRMTAYEEQHTAFSYAQLVHVTLAKLITFNKRRAGETARIELKQYECMPHVIGLANEEFSATLQPSEKKLCERLHVMSITGKRGRTVPLLLTADLKKALDLITDPELRMTVGVRPSNVYVFARACVSSLHSFRGSDCVKMCVAAAKCEKPETLTSRFLRKYISTVSQVMALTPNELEWLTGHLGHNTDVHKLFYRMHISTIELAKVSKLLIAVDEGKAHLYAGKSMQDIDLDDVPGVTDVNMTEGSEEHRVQGDLDKKLKAQSAKKKKLSEDEGSSYDEDVEPSDEDMVPDGELSLPSVSYLAEQTSHCTLPVKPQSSSDNHKPVEVRQRNRKRRGPSVQIDSDDEDWEVLSKKRRMSHRVPWSVEEKEVVLAAFGMHIKKGTLPGMKDCEKLKASSGSVLANRPWRDIKYCVKNIITASRRMTSRS